MKGEFCLCPKTFNALIAFLTKSIEGRKFISDKLFSVVRKQRGKIRTNFRSLKDDPDLDLKAIENIRKELKTKRKKRRTAKQIRATKKLIAFNKRRRARR